MLRLTANFFYACSAALLVLGCAAEAERAAEQSPALELTGRVVDAADILSPEFEQSIDARLAKLEADTLVQLVLVTTPDLQDYSIEDYTRNLANAWGIGSAERDDGLVILVAPHERKVRISVGYGLESTVEDDEAAAIIDNKLLPHFRKNDFEAGFNAAVESLILEVTPVEQKDAA